MFWNAEFNAVAALPALFDVFLRDTQKLAIAVDANRLISSAQLLLLSPVMHSAFCSPDIAAVGEAGMVRSSLDILRVRTTSDLSVSSAMSVAADVFVPFFINSPPQLLLINAPLANALGEVRIMRDNEFERRARRAEMYERGAAVLQARLSLTGSAEISSPDPILFRAMCTQQYCAFMSDLAPVASIDTHPISNATIYPLPVSSQLQIVQRQIRSTIGASCLLEPDHSCRCCPASALPPLSRAVDAQPGTYWMSPPLRPGSFFGLDFLSPARLRSITVDVGHTFQSALILEVLHSLSDAWVPLHSSPHTTRLQSAKGSSDSSVKHNNFIMRFTYNLERELRDVWRLQTGAFQGVHLPVFSVQMVRFRTSKASPHPFVVYEIKYEVASKE